jgi:predicted amidophosphoribosyltransferase
MSAAASTTREDAPGTAAELGRALLDLVLPAGCAGCGAPGRALCARCLAGWSAPPRRCEHGAGRLDRMDGTVLPVWALAENAGSVRRAVVAWKDGGRADVTPWFAELLARAAAWLTAGGAPLAVVPAPASPCGRARRGEDLVAALARACAARAPAGSAVVPALRLTGRGRDQVGLGLRGRADNLAGRVRVRARYERALVRARVLVVDDVLTTGATLAACRTALERAGAQVAGGLVLAVTRPPGAPTAWLVDSPEAG